MQSLLFTFILSIINVRIITGTNCCGPIIGWATNYFRMNRNTTVTRTSPIADNPSRSSSTDSQRTQQPKRNKYSSESSESPELFTTPDSPGLPQRDTLWSQSTSTFKSKYSDAKGADQYYHQSSGSSYASSGRKSQTYSPGSPKDLVIPFTKSFTQNTDSSRPNLTLLFEPVADFDTLPRRISDSLSQRSLSTQHRNPLTSGSTSVVAPKWNQIDCPFLSSKQHTFLYFTAKLNLLKKTPLFVKTILGQRIEINNFFRAIQTVNNNIKQLPESIRYIFVNNSSSVIKGTDRIIKMAKNGYFHYIHPSDNNAYNKYELITIYKDLLPFLNFTKVPKFLTEENKLNKNESNELLQEILNIITYQYSTELIDNIFVFSGITQPTMHSQDSIITYNDSKDLHALKANYFLDVFNFDRLFDEHSNVCIKYETKLYSDQQVKHSKWNMVPVRLLSIIHHIGAIHAIQRHWINGDTRTLTIKYGLEHGYDANTHELFYIVYVSDDGPSIVSDFADNDLMYTATDMEKQIRFLLVGCQKEMQFEHDLLADSLSFYNLEDICYQNKHTNNEYEDEITKYLDSVNDNIVDLISTDIKKIHNLYSINFLHLHSLEIAAIMGRVQRYALYQHKGASYNHAMEYGQTQNLCGFKSVNKHSNELFCKIPIALLKEPLLDTTRDVISYPLARPMTERRN